MADLKDLTNQLKENNRENMLGHQETRVQLSGLNKRFDGFFNMIRNQQLDNLEKERERKQTISRSRPESGPGNNKGFQFPMIAGLTGIGAALAGLTASLAAVGAALAGLRGWELGALKKITRIEDAFKAIDQMFINTRARLLRAFGLDPTLGKTDVDGKRRLQTPVRTQILNAMDDLRVRVFKTFGLGADGKLITVQGADGKFKVPTIGKITLAIKDLFAPVIRFADGVKDVLKAGALPILVFLKSIGVTGLAGGGKIMGMVGAVGRLASKILFPLGILFSAKAAFDAWFAQDENATFTQKFTAATFAFLGDFIGAPLDLLKKGISYLFKKAFGIETDENGNILGSGVAPAIARAIDGFSFEGFINRIPELVTQAFDFAVDSVAAGIGGIADFGSMIGEKIQNFFELVLKSIADFFGFEMETTAEKNVRLARNRVGALKNQLEHMQKYDSGLNTRDYNRVSDAEERYADAVRKFGADSQSAQNALKNLNEEKQTLTDNIVANRRRAGEIRALEYEIQAAQSEATRLQNIVGQIGDTITNNSSTTGMMLGQPKPTNDRSDFAIGAYG